MDGWIERLVGISIENEWKKTGTCAKMDGWIEWIECLVDGWMEYRINIIKLMVSE